MQTWMILLLWLMYLGLTANLEPSNLVVGLLIAVTLTAFLHPDRLSVDLRQSTCARCRAPPGLWPATCSWWPKT